MEAGPVEEAESGGMFGSGKVGNWASLETGKPEEGLGGLDKVDRWTGEGGRLIRERGPSIPVLDWARE